MMHESWGSRSFFTSKAMLFSYYICALLSFFTGFTAFIALFGSVFSRYIAHKEMAMQAAQHCKWIFRSIWIAALLAIICFALTLFGIGEDKIVIADISLIDNFEGLWGNPHLRHGLQLILIMLGFLFLLLCWFVYRMVYGMMALMNSRPLWVQRNRA